MPHPPIFKIDGLPVKNLKKKLRLTITSQDCDKATKKAPNACAAALAAMRGVPNCLEARVHIGRVFLRIKDGAKEFWWRGRTTGALRTEITSFDRGGTFEPGVYDINPLPPSDRPTGKRRGTEPVPKHGRPGHHRAKPKILQGVRGHATAEYSIKRFK